FAGLLVDGGPHTFTVTPYGAADGWTVDSTLFLDTDHHAARTSGALTEDTLSLSPSVTTTETPGAGDLVDVRATAHRSGTTSGWLDTSAGRVRTTVTQQAGYLNTDAVSSGGQRQVMSQRENGTTVVTTTPEHGRATAARHSWDYPITVDSDVPLYTD